MRGNLIRPVFVLEERVRRLRRDEGASVMLLSGMMAFLLAIMAVYSIYTSKAVYNRIAAQNAADGAADAAALWQARGLNLLQELNNFHYQFNASIFALETGALVVCATIPDAVGGEATCCVASLVGWCDCDSAINGVSGLCSTCNSAATLNDTQHSVASTILGIQQGITYLFPGMAFVYANQVAQVSGGDSLTDAFPQYVSQTAGTLLQTLGIPIPADLSGVGSGPLQSFTQYLPAIYAAPIDPTSLSLNAQSVTGNNWPWKWNLAGLPEDLWKGLACAAWEIGKWSCRGDLLQGGQWWGSFDDHDWYTDWGWDDSYYQGHPGVMTWMAGKAEQDGLPLGNLRWLNPNPTPPPEVTYWLNQQAPQMYMGSSLSGSELTIPAFIAVASSQVEGVGAIAKDISPLPDGFGNTLKAITSILNYVDIFDVPPVDSTPRLISVHFTPTTQGSDYLIYH